MALQHPKPGELVDLPPLGPKLKDARSTAVIKSDHFEVIRLMVQAGTEIPPHEVSGNITLHCLEGCIELGLEGTSLEMKANEWVYLEGGASHSVKGIEDSSLLLTILLDTGA